MSNGSASGLITRKEIRQFFALTSFAWVVLTAPLCSGVAQTSDQPISFTELSAEHEGNDQIAFFPRSLTFASQLDEASSTAQIESELEHRAPDQERLVQDTI
jgi:hypothetical protein